MKPMLALCLVLWAGAVQAQERFAEPWTTICGMGDDAGQGCDDIRAREIVDASAAPWRAIGRVNFASTDLRSHCTGVLVTERHVLTAAHCLYNRARKRWIPASSIRFAAGYQRGRAVSVAAVRSYRMDPEQGRGGRFDNRTAMDWAVLELDAPLGRELGTLPLATLKKDAHVAGYPGLRPHVLSIAPCGTVRASDDLLIATCPTMSGDSGAPLLIQSETGPRVIGILSRVAPTPDGIDALFLSTDLFQIGEH